MKDDGFAARSIERIGRFPSTRILVVGDLMLDEYVWGSVRQISPEAPVPVVAVTRETRTVGGAANVAWNIAGLGAQVEVAGLVGEDGSGREIARILRKQGVGTDGLIRDGGRPTIVKTRVIAHSQQVVRVDRETREHPGRESVTALRAFVLARMERCNGVVLSDYRKGTLARELLESIVQAARVRGIFVAVDPKQNDFAYYRGCTLITPNRSEAEAALGGKELRGDLEIGEGGKPSCAVAGRRPFSSPGGKRG